MSQPLSHSPRLSVCLPVSLSPSPVSHLLLSIQVSLSHSPSMILCMSLSLSPPIYVSLSFATSFYISSCPSLYFVVSPSCHPSLSPHLSLTFFHVSFAHSHLLFIQVFLSPTHHLQFSLHLCHSPSSSISPFFAFISPILSLSLPTVVISLTLFTSPLSPHPSFNLRLSPSTSLSLSHPPFIYASLSLHLSLLVSLSLISLSLTTRSFSPPLCIYNSLCLTSLSLLIPHSIHIPPPPCTRLSLSPSLLSVCVKYRIRC